ncbi:MAG: PadR family transcriptional regulator [Steroidobacteraceae bacterium]|jgi:PadR family transcriptional regulator PadR|nr:PadR family transcriptional regulator [Steroidobacteraceae bacterium]
MERNPETFEAGADASEAGGLARKFQKELNAGLVALVLLGILDRAEEDLYGYQIAKQLQHRGGPASLVKQGALYPVLRTLSASGLLASRVVPSYSGPPRRYYRITPAGRAALVQWREIWRQTRDLVNEFTEPGGSQP